MRRKKTSVLDDITALVAMLPWWAGVLLAVASYLLLHSIASRTPVTTVKPGEIHSLMYGAIAQGISTVAQYVLPGLCLVGALLSFIKRKKRQSLIANVSESKSADALNSMSWREFEMLVGEAFRLQGFRVTETGAGGPDGGIDLLLNKGTEQFLVQCKQWKALKVGVTTVRELFGVMAARGAAGSFVVTSGRFTQDAVDFAAGRNITLVDGPRLLGLIEQVRSARRKINTLPPQPAVPTALPVPAEPACPSCGSAMKKRIAKRGAYAGNEFWGCMQYPACKGTRNA